MKKPLSVCIPTYKRPQTLRRCIESVVAQIEQYSLADRVDVYVANDASPDDTAAVIDEFAGRPGFSQVSRAQNLGMNQNIKAMLQEASAVSEYQLILTDDDYLQPDVLPDVVEFLQARLQDEAPVPAIWTPRYSYTEDLNLHKIVCSPFAADTVVAPSATNAGKYMRHGFILSGLFVRSDSIDFEFWDEYSENAYFPILFFGDLILRFGACYWHRNIVHHTVLNECHWERWGKNDAMIEFRLFSDYANAFSVMRRHLDSPVESIRFYLASFASIRHLIVGRLRPENLCRDPKQVFSAIEELKRDGFMVFEWRLRLLILAAFSLSAVLSVGKILITRATILFTRRPEKLAHYQKRISKNLDMLTAMPVLARAVL